MDLKSIVMPAGVTLFVVVFFLGIAMLIGWEREQEAKGAEGPYRTRESCRCVCK